MFLPGPLGAEMDGPQNWVIIFNYRPIIEVQPQPGCYYQFHTLGPTQN